MLKELIKEILKEELTQKETSVQKTTTPNVMIGKIVMVRTYSAGVHFGTLVSKDGKEIVLRDARRVFYWTNACSLSQLANQGSQNKNTENKISVAVSEILLTEAIEIIPMTKESFDNLTEVIWKK